MRFAGSLLPKITMMEFAVGTRPKPSEGTFMEWESDHQVTLTVNTPSLRLAVCGDDRMPGGNDVLLGVAMRVLLLRDAQRLHLLDSGMYETQDAKFAVLMSATSDMSVTELSLIRTP